MSESYYKGYWMLTNRCNLRCSYCVLENAPHQLKAELDLDAKKEMISHLYHNLGFRRLTLSGGEVIIIGRKPPKDFIEILRHIRTFRSDDSSKNLEIELYTNGTLLDEAVADEMEGVVDMVAVTIDGAQDSFLTQIGRNNQKFGHYFDRIVKTCKLLTKKGIKLKLHSVISQKNHLFLANEIRDILNAIQNAGGNISKWKFYQYMSYDSPERDQAHAIPTRDYERFKEKAAQQLSSTGVTLHFKDNQEMNASLFNILSYGNAQYMRTGDTWSTSKRTEDLRSYGSMSELFARHDIDENRFRHFHEITQ
ncbi:MAG: Antilisterial bacteriocin subtilosin biosynthesis protein AlbA [Chlamydiae bacterium]|nr:Antilisterial bacteriocin subtilosin biosynthesis protein AlbA [Chlamydiota bacterium]